jgi:TolB-like protein/Tfp pilus assembly protein PilF
LENLSGDPEQEFFADGMTEALIAELSKIRALKVISRTSVMQYKGVKKRLPQIARELKVDGVVEGSVLREGERVRITVQLIHADSDAHLWAESYTREVRGVLALQGDVARAIAREIRVAVTPDEESRLSKSASVNPEAHTLTLQGRHLINQQNTSAEALQRSIQLFQEALKRDAGYAPAYVGLAEAQLTLSGVGYLPMLTGAPLARAAAQRAIDLDPSLGEAYAARAMARYNGEWDWAGAEEDFRRAIALSPGSAFVHDQYAGLLVALKRFEEAMGLGQRALELDPLSSAVGVHVAQYRLYAGQLAQAEHECTRVLTFNPEDIYAKWLLGVTLSEHKKYDEAIAVFLSRKVPSADTNWSLAYTYGVSGRKQEARRILDYLLRRSRERYVWPSIIAFTYIGLGEKDKAFEWLERGYGERDWWLLWLQVEPRYDPIRSDRRFPDLLQRMKFPSSAAKQ